MIEDRRERPHGRDAEPPSGAGLGRALVAGLLLAAALLAGWTWGRASAPAAGAGRAGRFVLVDGAGEVRAELTMARDSAVGFAMRDERGRIRLIAGVNSDGSPFLRMLNEFGNPVWMAP